MDEKKLKLIEALKEERSRFAHRGHCTLEHDIAIEYLETGRTDEDPEEFELLDAVMNDYKWIDYINQCFVLIEAENSVNTSELDSFLESIKDQEVRWFNDKKSGEIIKNGIKFSFKIEEGCISKKIEVYYKVDDNIENFLKLANNNYKGA